MLVSQLCNASLSSQCPSEVCQACFKDKPNALWLAWLRCINTEEHKNEPKTTVVANVKEKVLIKVRPLPWVITRLDQVKLATHHSRICTCQFAHSEEEFLYWQWQVAKTTIFSNVSQHFSAVYSIVFRTLQ